MTKPKSGTHLRILAAVLVVALESSCSTLTYYAQSIDGQIKVLEKRRPIDDLLKDPATPAALKVRLAAVLRMREFATRELGLPDNGSYHSYADLRRPYVVWNVYATPEFSLQPKEWCFPVAGCVDYRGYFERQAAKKFAAHLQDKGYDVYVAGITAYSTLGWFRDPLLNTVLRGSDTDIAGLIFHELAHQELYIRDDTAFDESFAMAVEFEGIRRWLRANGENKQIQTYRENRNRSHQLTLLLLRYRARLESLYASAETADRKRQDKQRLFSELRVDYTTLKTQWGGYSGYDAWFAHNINNAYFVPIRLYNRYVPAFDALLHSVGGNLPAFYAKVRAIGQLPPEKRHMALAALIQAHPAGESTGH